MKPLVTPVVNINGTSKSELLRQQTDIMSAISDLQKVMRQATPNGRDFQTVGQGFAEEARDAFNERYNLLTKMYEEFQHVAIEIQKQQGGRS